ncbi:MAG: cyclic pyranopterin phosphate synthase [Myxococcota bacterium]
MIELQDHLKRNVRYLRVSVTDRCNFRCQYCMPERVEFMPRKEVLSYEELAEIVGMFVEQGVDHVRITGGEPLARKDIVELVRQLSAIDGLKDLAMTTNGALLTELAQPLVDAGLTRINVSIDTVDPDRFKELTRWGELGPVVDGIRAARAAGLGPIKLNAVLIKGTNDAEAGDLIRFARREEAVLRFIEYMPIGIDQFWSQDRFTRIDDVRTLLERQGFGITPIETDATGPERPVGGGPAQYWHVTPPEGGAPQVVGFIAALTHNFCAACNRIRLTADGRVRECLTSGGQLSLRDMLRSGASRSEMVASIRQALYGKVDGHSFDERSETGGRGTFVPMSALGG